MNEFQAQEAAAFLYDGGWRAADADDFKAEYNLTDEEAEAIAAALQKIERSAEQ